MKTRTHRTAFLIAASFLFACNGQKQADPTVIIPANGNIIAHEIVYDVEIKNPNPEDQWMDEALMGLDHEALVDFVFEGIYSGRFTVFEIFEGTPIKTQKIIEMEEGGEFSRNQIGKFQFMEEWVVDPEQMTFSKKVTEIRMGLQKFNREGYLTGYAPLFRVVL